MISSTCDPEQVLAAIQPERRIVMRRLRVLRRKLRRHLVVSGLVRLFALVLALCAVSFAVDRWLRLETSTRIALGVLALLAVLAAVLRWVVAPWRLRLDDLDLAEVMEKRRAGLGQRITDVLQLPDLLTSPQLASPSLVRQAIFDHARQLEQIDLRQFVDMRRHVRNLLLLAALIAVPAAAITSWPQLAELWARRWLLGDNVRWPQATYLALEGLGDRTRLLAPRGEDLTVHLTAQPTFTRVDRGWQLAGRGKPLLVEAKERPTSDIPEQVSIRTRSAAGEKLGNFTHYEGADFRYEFPPLAEPLEIQVSGGDDWFGPVRIEPIDRPSVSSLTLIARRPGSSTEERHQIGAADERLVFLPQTKLELLVVGNEPLKTVEFVAPDQLAQPLEAIDETTFHFAWTMEDARTFELRLVSSASGLTSKPYFLTIGLLIDREPRLTIRSSGVGKRVTPQARIPLTVHAVDDFGVGELGMEMERTESTSEKSKTANNRWELEKFDADPKQPLPLAVDRTPLVKLPEYSLAPGQSIRLRATAQDRCALEPHTGYSRWLGFQVVTPEELFYEILVRQREQRTKFTAALSVARSQVESLDSLASLDGVPPLVRSHQAVARQVNQVANSLDAILQELALNELGNPAARELLQEKIIKPLHDLHAGPLTRLRGRIDQLSAGDAIDPAERLAARQLQQEVVGTMEQILAQMQQWESFVDVINQLRQIIKLQTQLRDGTEQAKKKQTDELFDE